jgi:hypothetical protein
VLPQVNAAGRVFVNHNDFSGPPKFWNRGVGYDNEGRMMTTSTLTASDVYLGGLRLDVQGRLVVTGVTGQPQVSVRGCPVNNGVANAGALTISTAATPVATDPYVSGVRVKNAAPGSELVYFIQSVPTGFLAEMSVGHMLTVGINPQGNRVGYRRNEWGSFLPDDVPSLERLFTNLNNNRLVVQAKGE